MKALVQVLEKDEENTGYLGGYSNGFKESK